MGMRMIRLSGSRCVVWKLAACSVSLAVWIGCNANASLPTKRNDLETMTTARIHIGQHMFEVWLATEPQEQQLGLMQVTAEELTPLSSVSSQEPSDVYRGMLFVFPNDRLLSFWMYNTITPLDIAYIRSDGQIVSTHTMAPLETRVYPSIEPARFALEIPAGLLAQLGIKRGDHVEIPESVLKGIR